MEYFTARENVFEDSADHERQAFLFNVTSAEFVDEVRNSHFTRADLNALTATDTEFVDFFEVAHAVEKSRQDSTYTACVDVTVYVTTYERVNRTYVEAGCATYAVVYFFENRVFSSFQTTVVEKDYVAYAIFFNPLAVFFVDDRRSTVNHRHIACHSLARAVTRQETEDLSSILRVADEFFVTDNNNVNARHSSCQTSVTFVRYETNSTVFGDTEVSTRNTHVSFDEFATEVFTSSLDHVIDDRFDFAAEFFGEVLSALFFAQVDSRHNHVARFVTGDGDDPFTHVSFHYMVAFFFKIFIQMNFFSSHRFGFDDAFNVVLFTYFVQVFFESSAVFCAVEVSTASFNGSFEFVSDLFEMLNNINFHSFERVAETINVFNVFVCFQTSDRVLFSEASKRAAEYGVVQFGIDFFSDIAIVFSHYAAPPLVSSIAMMTKRPGP